MNPNYYQNPQNPHFYPPQQPKMPPGPHYQNNNYSNRNNYNQNYKIPPSFNPFPPSQPYHQNNNMYPQTSHSNYNNYPQGNLYKNNSNYTQNNTPNTFFQKTTGSSLNKNFDPWEPNKKENNLEPGEITSETLYKEKKRTITQSSKANNIEKESNLNDKSMLCQVCQKEKHKYRCPNCGTMTCSLKCVKTHKNLKNCQGIFKAEKFITKTAFSEKSGLRDYNYLNGMITNIDKVKKRLSLLKKTNNSSEALRYKLLRVYAKKIHEIDLQFLPFVFTKHRENLSFYYTKKRKIFWSVELYFFNPAEENPGFLRLLNKKPVCEEICLKDLILEEFDFLKEAKILERGINVDKENLRVLLEEKKLFFFKEGKKENANEKEFFQIRLVQNLADILKGESIIEFPRIYAVHYFDLEKFTTNYKTSMLENE